MSHGGWGSPFRRWSPFGREPPYSPPEVRDSDYHYISQDDIVDPPSEYQPDYYSGHGRRVGGRPIEDEDDDGPDILLLKHRGTTYPLHFPAFSIGEGLVRVGRVRDEAAAATGTRNPRRIRLLYKGKQLKNDMAKACDEGLKQNSELMCVVSETVLDDGMSSSEEDVADEDEVRVSDSGARIDNEGRRNTGRSGRKNGPGKKKPSRDTSRDTLESLSRQTSSRTGGASFQPSPGPSFPAQRPQPSPSPGPTPFDPSLPSAAPTRPSGPKTAMDQIAELETKYRRDVAGLVEQLLKNPPSEKKTRDYEVIKLTETVERDFLLKTDAIETEGRDDIRTRRRGLVKELNAVLQRLDAAKKQWNN